MMVRFVFYLALGIGGGFITEGSQQDDCVISQKQKQKNITEYVEPILKEAINGCYISLQTEKFPKDHCAQILSSVKIITSGTSKELKCHYDDINKLIGQYQKYNNQLENNLIAFHAASKYLLESRDLNKEILTLYKVQNQLTDILNIHSKRILANLEESKGFVQYLIQGVKNANEEIMKEVSEKLLNKSYCLNSEIGNSDVTNIVLQDLFLKYFIQLPRPVQSTIEFCGIH